jgi:acetyltransferase-like isoleucine patch superfamily enzyme
MSRLGDFAGRRLEAGFLGAWIRRAVRGHHYIFPAGAEDRVTIGPGAELNDALLNVSSGRISIGPDVLLGHGVSILTGTHDHRRFGAHRRFAIPPDGRDVEIESGVWVASNATVVGPCRIGEHAVVAAGAVVIDDVPAYAIVAGIPAHVVGRIPPP